MERRTYKGGEVEWKEARKEDKKNGKESNINTEQRVEVEMRMAERLYREKNFSLIVWHCQ